MRTKTHCSIPAYVNGAAYTDHTKNTLIIILTFPFFYDTTLAALLFTADLFPTPLRAV